MVPESIQSSFCWIENKISFHFIVKTKTAIWTFEKEQQQKKKHLNLITNHFKLWNFNSRGSPVNDDKINFGSDKKSSLLSEMCGEIFLKYNI